MNSLSIPCLSLCSEDPATYTDATPFFQAIHTAAWQKQIVLAPHPYCPAVTGAEDHFEGVQKPATSCECRSAASMVVAIRTMSARGSRAGTGLWERLQWSFGDKQAQGFTYKGTTKKYPVLIGVCGPVHPLPRFEDLLP